MHRDMKNKHGNQKNSATLKSVCQQISTVLTYRNHKIHLIQIDHTDLYHPDTADLSQDIHTHTHTQEYEFANEFVRELRAGCGHPAWLTLFEWDTVSLFVHTRNRLRQAQRVNSNKMQNGKRCTEFSHHKAAFHWNRLVFVYLFSYML